ncbi:hypothetical protein B0I37DRAFT_300275 [Chaetomium sp. MPI-CAGE-AT-0009]|nr:hypothetical protein B0I37DRAFT_300275 [Chaetomium sp. MPI-CAGE-AT-0009]
MDIPGPQSQLKAQCLSAAKQIVSECAAILRGDIIFGGLTDCGDPLVQLLQRQASQLLTLAECRWGEDLVILPEPEAEHKKALLLKRLDDLISSSYDKFYAYCYKDLPVCWRLLYTDASILKFTLLYMSWPPARLWSRWQYDRNKAEEQLDDMIKTLDKAIILAGAAGEERGRMWIDRAFALLEEVWQVSPETSDPWNEAPSFSSHEPFTPPVTHPVRRVHDMSLEDFQTHLDTREAGALGPLPLVITGLISNWPALTTQPWRKPSYLLSRTFGGRRLVPVEVGRSYVDAGWGQKILPFGTFIEQHITDPPAADPQTTTKQKTGYLAQHPLLTHLPALREDILLPDLVYTSPPPHPMLTPQNQPHHPPSSSQDHSHSPNQSQEEDQEDEPPKLNAWFGPPGTITPLHTDPHHNLLAQVVGRKYVRLYAPDEDDFSGTSGDGESKENYRGLEEGWQEEFKKVDYLDCILNEGDVLYIPVGWWHYVRGLSVSFSVSFWWN